MQISNNSKELKIKASVKFLVTLSLGISCQFWISFADGERTKRNPFCSKETVQDFLS